MSSHKFGFFLTPPPTLYSSYALCLMYLCHTIINPPLTYLCGVTYECYLPTIDISRILRKYNFTKMSWHVYANLTCNLFDHIFLNCAFGMI